MANGMADDFICELAAMVLVSSEPFPSPCAEPSVHGLSRWKTDPPSAHPSAPGLGLPVGRNAFHRSGQDGSDVEQAGSGGIWLV